jgi:hypothetical protein
MRMTGFVLYRPSFKILSLLPLDSTLHVLVYQALCCCVVFRPRTFWWVNEWLLFVWSECLLRGPLTTSVRTVISSITSRHVTSRPTWSTQYPTATEPCNGGARLVTSLVDFHFTISLVRFTVLSVVWNVDEKFNWHHRIFMYDRYV